MSSARELRGGGARGRDTRDDSPEVENIELLTRDMVDDRRLGFRKIGSRHRSGVLSDAQPRRQATRQTSATT